MENVEIPYHSWSRALDEFSAFHEGRLISIDVLSLAIGAQPEVRNLPLVGIVAEPRGGAGNTITVSAATPAGDQITHAVHAPIKMWLERAGSGADAALQIESADGTITIVRFETPASPHTVARVQEG